MPKASVWRLIGVTSQWGRSIDDSVFVGDLARNKWNASPKGRVVSAVMRFVFKIIPVLCLVSQAGTPPLSGTLFPMPFFLCIARVQAWAHGHICNTRERPVWLASAPKCPTIVTHRSTHASPLPPTQPQSIPRLLFFLSLTVNYRTQLTEVWGTVLKVGRK